MKNFYKKTIAIMVVFLPLLITAQSKLFFCYDSAGNQENELFCLSNCSELQPCSVLSSKIVENKKLEIDNLKENSSDKANSFILFPNPTEGYVKLTWQEDISDLIYSIDIVGMSNPFYKNIYITKGENYIEANIKKEYTGIYIFKITLMNGEIVYKKLIKQ